MTFRRPLEFVTNSRRSAVYSLNGMVSSTQPLANSAGTEILSKGGNAMDACVAMSACLALIEPASTGIGGDCFVLWYDSKEKKVSGLNGSGRSARNITLDWLKKSQSRDVNGFRLAEDSVFKVNVPGAIGGWYDSMKKWGSGNVTFKEVLAPAIRLAEEGYPVSQISASLWKNEEEKLKRMNTKCSRETLGLFLPNGTAPREGQVVRNPEVGRALRIISERGKKGFYEGEIAEAIIRELNSRGHVMTREDFSEHKSTFVDPISYEFLGHKLWEIPPNGSGIIALMTLGLIKQLSTKGAVDLKKLKHNSSDYLHVIIECLKVAFKESEEYVNDYEHFHLRTGIDQNHLISQVLSDDYLYEEIKGFEMGQASDIRNVPNSIFKSDTVYFTATDKFGNACSFINSVYEGFGSGIIVPGYGFTLHNRGGNFTLNAQSRNCIDGNKRPYHTIIPGMITNSHGDELYASYGIMGGYNQPQAHVQVYMNMLLFGMTPQEALDAPRLTLTSDMRFRDEDLGCGSDGPVSNGHTVVHLEEGITGDVKVELERRGHVVGDIVEGHARRKFGRGQIIRREGQVWSGGSDMRGDGAAVPGG